MPISPRAGSCIRARGWRRRRDALRVLAARAALAWRREAAARGAAVAATTLRLRREMRAPLREASAVARLAERWRRAAALDMARAGMRVDTLAQNLAHLSPRHVLERGYAIVARKDGGVAGDVVQDARVLAPGEDVEITFARGRAGARVTGVEPASAPGQVFRR